MGLGIAGAVAVDAARVAQRLGDRAEDVRVAVGDALTGEHHGAVVACRERRNLGGEAALADPRVAGQQDEVGPPAGRRHAQHVSERAQLGVSSDER